MSRDHHRSPSPCPSRVRRSRSPHGALQEAYASDRWRARTPSLSSHSSNNVRASTVAPHPRENVLEEPEPMPSEAQPTSAELLAELRQLVTTLGTRVTNIEAISRGTPRD